MDENLKPVEEVQTPVVDTPSTPVVDTTPVEQTPTENVTTTNTEPKKKSNVGLIIVLVVVILLLAGGGIWYFFLRDKKVEKPSKPDPVVTPVEPLYSAADYAMEGNGLSDFDLLFLQMNNDKKNKIYSPLSIKYALAMLSLGAEGDSKKEIDTLIGKYEAKKYDNNENMSLANALFVRDSYKPNILTEYVDVLTDKFNADVVYDNFETAKTINNWVSNHTFNLINNLLQDQTVSSLDFALVNALAIDMTWVNAIQYDYDTNDIVPSMYYGSIIYSHETDGEFLLSSYVDAFDGSANLDFDGMDEQVVSAQIATTANKYDIVSDRGRDNLIKEVEESYNEFLSDFPECVKDETLAERTVDEVNKNYNTFKYSTDFSFYTDGDVTAFAKDLKTYGSTTLEYVAIMPERTSLEEYLKDIDSQKVSTIISSLQKADEYDTYEDGKITLLTGNIPMFKFSYNIDLSAQLPRLGISKVFNPSTANLTKLTKDKNAHITSALHSANIEFTNVGIKAAATTVAGGAGMANDPCNYNHVFNVEDQVNKINLDFNKPYLFLIHDKNTGEVWFAGSVYNPSTEYVQEDF